MKILPFLFVILLIVPILSSASNITVGPVTISGPTKVSIGSQFNYTVNVQQIFNHYKIIFILSGYNLTGASPINPQYLNGTFSPQNFSIRAPDTETTLFLFFQIVAYLNSQVFYYNITRTVQVLDYTNLTAKIYNPTQFEIKDLNVSFYVNNKYVGSSIVNISANSTEIVTYDWVSGILPSGIYTVTIKVNNPAIKIVKGNYNIVIQAGNPYIFYVYVIIIIIVVIIAVLAILTLIYNRRNRPKWKK